jgi:hypothetical protein
MSIILGFGQYHYDLTRQWAHDLMEKVRQADDPEAVAEAESKKTVDLNGAPQRVAWIHQVHVNTRSSDGYRSIVIDGKYCHYRDDHPLSPDGVAMLQIPFCVTGFFGDTWGDRTFVAV